MKYWRKGLSLAMAFAVCLSLAACQTEAPQSESQAFDAFLDRLFVEEMSNTDLLSQHYKLKDPEALGITPSEPTLGTISLAQMEEDGEEIAQTLAELEAFQYDSLTETQQETYDILKWYLELGIQGNRFDLYAEPNSPTLGVQSQLPTTLMEYAFYDETDIQEYLALVNDVGRYLDQCLAFQREKSKAGFFMPDSLAQQVIDNCKTFVENPESNYMLEVFDDKLEDIAWLTPEKREEYSAQNRKAVLDSMVPGYQRFIQGFEELLGTGRARGGACDLPDGQEYYAYLAKSATGSEKTPLEMAQAIDDRIDDIWRGLISLALMDEDILDRVYDSSNAPDVTEPEAILTALSQRIQTDYPAIGQVAYQINYVHESLQESMSPAFYFIPPIDAANENKIYLNPAHMDDPVYVFTTLAHEGYPGHLYQTNYALGLDLPNIRRILSFNGYSEGWATYVEYDSYSMTGLDGNLAAAIRLLNELSLAVQARVDIGINYEGWNDEKTGVFLSEFFQVDDDLINSVTDSVTADPANALSYYIGYLEFQELREYAEEELGDAFSAQAFHKAVLDVGEAPFQVVREAVEAYAGGQEKDR